MFKMAPLKTKDYYTDTEEYMNGAKSKQSYSDYLAKNNATDELRKARFTGDLATTLKIGDYTKEKYSKLYDGYDPSTDKKLIKTAGTKQHKPGIDILLTMPKSLSVLYAIADEETKAKIIRHMNATLDKLQSDMARDLMSSNKSTKYRQIDNTKTKALLCEFTHFENRNLDPHLHKHITLFNKAEFTMSDGKVKVMAIDTSTLMKRQKYFTALYETLLLSALETDGIHCERDNDNIHSFKVKQISDELCEISQSRRDELLTWAKRNGIAYSSLDDLAEKNEQAMEQQRHSTSGKKQELTYTALMKKFEGDYKGKFTPRELDDKNTPRKQESIRQSLNKQFVKDFNEKTIELKGHFDLHELDTAIINNLKFSEHFNSTEEIQARIVPLRNEIMKNLQVVYDKRNDTYTTKSIIETEREIVKIVKKLESKTIQYSKQDLVILDSNIQQVEEDIAKSTRKLTLGQRQAIDLIKASNDKAIVNVIGSAGVGKTSAIILKNTEIFNGLYDFHGLSTQGLTAQALIEAKISNRANIQQFLSDYDKGNIKFNKPPFLVVDESGMVGATHMKRLLDIVEKHNGKILLVGDHKQLSSVNYGTALRDITKTLNRNLTVEVNDNVRQQKGTISATISEGFRDRKAQQTIDLMVQNNLVKTATSDKLLRQELVNDYFGDLQSYAKEQNKSIKDCIAKFSVLSSTNANVNAMNDLIRNRLIELGEVSTEQQLVRVKPAPGERHQIRAFATGDSIMIKQKMKLPNGDLQNGTTATVKAINEKTMLIQASDGKEYELQLDKHIHFNHSYSYTTHKSQGATMVNTYIYSTGNTNANAAYVDFSRHTNEVKLYIEENRLQDFVKTASEEVKKYTTLNNSALEKQAKDLDDGIKLVQSSKAFVGNKLARESHDKIYTIDIQQQQSSNNQETVKATVTATKEDRAKALSNEIEKKLAQQLNRNKSSTHRRLI